jgi:hypothetical protein
MHIVVVACVYFTIRVDIRWLFSLSKPPQTSHPCCSPYQRTHNMNLDTEWQNGTKFVLHYLDEQERDGNTFRCSKNRVAVSGTRRACPFCKTIKQSIDRDQA